MKRLCFLLATALLLCPSGLAAKEGTVTQRLKNIFGLTTTGAPKPSANGACRAKFGNLAGIATTTYKIDQFQSGQTIFRSRKYDLHPLGNDRVYALSYFQNGMGLNPPIYAVNFVISYQFTNPHTAIDLLLDANTNCKLTDMNRVRTPQ